MDCKKTDTEEDETATVVVAMGNADTPDRNGKETKHDMVICDTESSDSTGEVSVDLECEIPRPHVEADTVILGDANSDSLSDDTSRPADVRGTGQRSESDPPVNVSADVSITGNVANTDNKRTNLRTTGKASKKEKPTPVRKKDGETQVCADYLLICMQ